MVPVQIKQKQFLFLASKFIRVFVRGADYVITLEPPFLIRDQDMICLIKSDQDDTWRLYNVHMALVTTVIKIP